MTREEAIEILRKNRPTSDPRPCGIELCDAVDMAISALRQQEHRCPCDLCNFGPTSSMRGKPCTMCPAVPKQETVTERNELTNADRIRASIEDNKKLAELTIRRKSVFRRTKGYTETVYVCSDGSVTDDWGIAFNREMDWLQQPAGEEEA